MLEVSSPFLYVVMSNIDDTIRNSSARKTDVTWHDGTNKQHTWRRDKRKGNPQRGCVATSRCVCKAPLLDGPDCKMATREIIVRTRDLPSVALSPSQRAAEVAMATDRRKPTPTLLFPRMQAVGPPSLALFASNDSVASRPAAFTSHGNSFFFSSRTFPLCFFAVSLRVVSSLRWSDSQTSS